MDHGFKHRLWIVLVAFVLGAGGGRPPVASSLATADVGEQSGSSLPPFSGQLTFLYFNDVDKAAEFYGGTLGLKKTFDLGWVRIFAISGSSYVAVVDGAKGAHKPSNDKPVTLSMIVTDPKDVDRWYENLKARGVSIHMPPFDATTVNVREFRFMDPEGYTLEIFAWLPK